MKQYYGCLFFASCLFLLCPSLAEAEHTPEHRFTIYGYVYDDSGRPLRAPVAVIDAGGRILATTDTSRSGYYSIHLHLHNSNHGDKLLIRSGAGEKELIVRFDPEDKTTQRKAEVNFGVIPPSSGLISNKPFLFGIATILVSGTYYVLIKRRRNRKRQSSKKKRKHHEKV